MAIGLDNNLFLRAVAGVRLGSAATKIRYKGRDDLLLIALAKGTHVAVVFTRNAFRAAPVLVAQEYAKHAKPRFLLVNAGNANAGTGEAGLQSARACCQAVADLANCEPHEVWPFSTGVIGEFLLVDPICKALPTAWAALSEEGWNSGARTIMTTDTVAKGISICQEIAGKRCSITGIVKGSGMIRPDMATMLCYIATDAMVEEDLLQICLEHAVERSFHCITIDGDTSTNDACVLLATGKGELCIDRTDSPTFNAFQAEVTKVCEQLAEAVVRDAEGITRLLQIEVNTARDLEEARNVAFTVAHSPLVKTALFAGDPNWGRILAAIGRAGMEGLDINKVTIQLGEVCILRDGQRAQEYREEEGQRLMSQEQVRLRIILGRGQAKTKIWTSDLSHEYIRINAEYRT